jgi:hypothetical protein
MEAAMTDDDLDAFFAAAKADSARPSPALMARILQDAAAEQPRAAPPTTTRPRFTFAALVAALGGGGALAGLATATVAGLWIGLAPPIAVEDFAATLWVSGEGDSVDLIPDLEGMISDAEG